MPGKLFHWQRVYEALRSEIETGTIPAHGRLPTIREACRRFQVSTITVRHAFDELERQGLIVRKRFIGSRVRRQQGRRRAYIVVPDYLASAEAHPNWFRMEMQQGISDAAKEHGVTVEFLSATMLTAELRQERLLITTEIHLPKKEQARLCRSNRVVSVRTYSRLPNAAHLEHDLFQAAQRATRHLVDLGHRRIALLLSSIARPSQRDRFEGYARVLKRSRIPWDWDLVHELFQITKDPVDRALRYLFSLERPPTAIVCGSDLAAVMVLRYSREQGIEIPGALSVTGIDNTQGSATTEPPLTTVDLQLYKVGYRAMTLLASDEEPVGREPVLRIPPRFIERKSTGPCRI